MISKHAIDESASSRHKAVHAIETYYERQSKACASSEHLEAFLQILEALSPQNKALTEIQLTELNQTIQAIPTGRQKRLEQARDDTL